MHRSDSSPRGINNTQAVEKVQREVCTVPVGDRICGETQTLQITKEFRQLYEDKLKQIDTMAGGDCTQAKITLLQDWVRDLTEQNDMLVHAVEELELEATERVQILEDKLRRSATAALEVMKKYNEVDLAFNIDASLQRVVHLQDDLQNMKEFIRRARDEGVWNADGLHFHEVLYTDLFGSEPRCFCNNGPAEEDTFKTFCNSASITSNTTGLEEQLKEKDRELKDLHAKMDRLSPYGDIDSILAQLDQLTIVKKQMIDTERLYKELKEIVEVLEEENKEVQRNNLKMKSDFSQLEEERELYKQERDEYERKHRDSLKAMECLSLDMDREKEEYERKHRESLDTIESLKLENEQHKSLVEAIKAEKAQELECYELRCRAKEQELEAVLRDLDNVKQENQMHNETIDCLKQQLDGKRANMCMNSTMTDGSLTELHLSHLFKDEDSDISEIEFCQLCPGSLSTDEQTATKSRGIQHMMTHMIYDLSDPNLESCAAAQDQNKTVNASTMSHGYHSADHGMSYFEDNSGEVQEPLAKKRYIKPLSNEESRYGVKSYDDSGYSQFKDHLLNQSSPHGRASSSSRYSSQSSTKDRTLNGKSKRVIIDNTKSPEDIEQEEKLDSVMHDLSDSVSRIMKNRPSVMQQRIMELEEQLAAAMRNKESAVEHERNKRNQEIANLKQTIQELEEALKDMRERSHNLQKAECTCGLKRALKKCQEEKNHLEKVIMYLKEEMQVLSDQLINLQAILSASNSNCMQENAELSETIIVLQEENERLKSQLVAENNLNHANAAKVAELQKEISNCAEQARQWENELYEARNQVEQTAEYNRNLQNIIADLKQKVDEFEQENAVSEVRSQVCQQEISICQDNLACLKDKLGVMKKMLHQKNEEIDKLQSQHLEKCNMLTSIKLDQERMKSHYEDDINDLKGTVRDLTEKLTRTEDIYQKVCEDHQKTQKKLLDCARNESHLQQNFCRKERALSERIHKYEKEQQDLLQRIGVLEQELTVMREDLTAKDEELSNARMTIHQMKGGACRLAAAQQEVVVLKDEMNKMLQVQDQLKMDNEKLRTQVIRLRANISSYQERSHSASEQLEQCLLELQAIQADKETADRRNEELTHELRSLQSVFTNLNRDYHFKTESFISIETELNNSRSNQQEICLESRNVVENVRHWLEEQKTINDYLNTKMKEKNDTIKRLRAERDHLSSKLQSSASVTEIPQLSSKTSRAGPSWQPEQHITWSLGSQGSAECISPTTSSGSAPEWYAYEDEAEDVAQNALPAVWVHRVESMAQDLQRTNNYWKERLADSDYIATRDN